MPPFGASPSPRTLGPKTPRAGIAAIPTPRGVHPSGNISNPYAPSGSCFGIWPPGGQEYYANGCYGHDEPGLQFYSNLPGSGGNVTWNVTLPISSNPNQTQSDLYTAIWFGMTLSDPYAWLDQCFLELQFYPDSDWNLGTSYGSWVGAAVAWQIEAATGYEDPCFYAQLNQIGGGELLMTQGDQITVTMNGWVGSPYGENITITDLTNGEASFVNLYNAAQNYPIDPAYATSSYPNSLQWTPGGEFPVVFAFETGHTSPPFPNNNSYGGCSAGPPPPTPTDPAVVCPSYDPGSWINDTVEPWKIATPTFFNATARERPAQVSFSQDLGGIAFIDPISGYTCAGRDGSAYCSYPWYSYSCSSQAFEFGATDYPGVTADFGGYNEYTTVFTQNALQLGYYSPTNFSVPSCGAPTYTIRLNATPSGAGNAFFLSQAVPLSRVFSGLLPGSYALGAVPRSGEQFASWLTTGSVTVSDASNPFTTLVVGGNGTVDATFTSGAVATTDVTFDSTPNSGHIVVLSSLTYTTGIPIATVSDGGQLNLTPGIYSVQAYPPPDYNFSVWQVVGASGSVAAPAFPYTWLVVPGGGGSLTVRAICVRSSDQDFLSYGVGVGSGDLSFAGGAVTTGSTTMSPVGTYTLTAYPATGYSFTGWTVYGSAVLSDFEARSNVTLEGGSAYVYANFGYVLTVETSPGSSGAVSVNGAAALANQTVVPPSSFVSLTVAPGPGFSFSHWGVSNRADEWVYPSGAGPYTVQMNGSGTVTAYFAAAAASNLTLLANPSTGGSIELNYAIYPSGTLNTTLANATYEVAPAAAPGYSFTGWSTSGPLSFTSGGLLVVGGWGGALTANYQRSRYLVTFLTDPPQGPSLTVGGPPGTLATNGATLVLTSGSLNLTYQLATNGTFLGWGTSPGLSVNNSQGWHLQVNGPGTLTLLSTAFTVSVGIQPGGPIDLGQSVHIWVTATGTGAFSYNWSGLPPGCRGGNVPSIACTPGATGVYSVNVTVSSSDGGQHLVHVGTIDVLAPLSVASFTASPVNFTVGGRTLVTLTPAGGIQPFHFQYSGLPAGCTAGNVASFACRPDTYGTYSLTAAVRDLTGRTVTAQTVFSVNPPPAIVAFNLSRPLIDAGNSIRLGIWPQGGTAPYSYAYGGLPLGCLGLNASTLTCAPGVSGTFTLIATVTDVDGFSASGNRSLMVLPPPSFTSFAPSQWNGTANDTLVLVASVAGGLAPYTYSYSGLPSGCHSRNASKLTCVPGLPGNFTLHVTVTDILGTHANASAPLSVARASGGTPGGGKGGGGGGGGGGTSGAPISAPLFNVVWIVPILAGAAFLVAFVAARRRSRPIVPEATDGGEPTEEPREGN